MHHLASFAFNLSNLAHGKLKTHECHLVSLSIIWRHLTSFGLNWSQTMLNASLSIIWLQFIKSCPMYLICWNSAISAWFWPICPLLTVLVGSNASKSPFWIEMAPWVPFLLPIAFFHHFFIGIWGLKKSCVCVLKDLKQSYLDRFFKCFSLFKKSLSLAPYMIVFPGKYMLDNRIYLY
jgi:hypothetical protein